MKYFTTVRKRRRGARVEWTARLIYKDQVTGKRKERSKSAASITQQMCDLFLLFIWCELSIS